MKSFFNSMDVDLAELERLCQQQTDREAYPRADEVVENVVIYHRDTLVKATDPSLIDPGLKSELSHCLGEGPGLFVVRQAYSDLSVIDRCTTLFSEIVSEESDRGGNRGDHFGSNQRIWNSLQKTCVAQPELFVDYYGNPILKIVSEAWLGPNYRITAQMNNVKPGSAAQAAHRDYHLGFQSSETIANFPLHAQVMSQYLTLQGAIAHSDMPLETGPTLLLPFSQQYRLGYMVADNAEFADYFSKHHVQLPLSKGDALFFNPALFHAAGNNQSETDRVANLIQVSSAFGRTMETINHRVMIESVYPVLQRLIANGDETERVENVIATVADGYSFPTNLDSDPPIDGKSPETQQHLVRRALNESWSIDALLEQLDRYESRRRS